MASISNVRNVAIIAHVDHGKTSLVDHLLSTARVFSSHQAREDRVMDRNDLERERGITILSKNCAIDWKGVRINLIDTPGHADFGGEVERVLRMADAAIIVVCAHEGPMPQTRFVLRKALDHKLALMVCINKVDRRDGRPLEARDELFELLIDLEAGDDVLDTPVCYASARDGRASMTLEGFKDSTTVECLLDALINEAPAPTAEPDKPLRMAVSQVDYDPYLGRIAIGRVEQGDVRPAERLLCCRWQGVDGPVEAKKVFRFSGVGREEVAVIGSGDIAALAGLDNVSIGDTICALDVPDPLPPVAIDAPTVALRFIATDSPFRGQDGRRITSRQLRERLEREAHSNVALRVSNTETPEQLEVAGRGVLHLGILIEEMRREGYEFQVSQPRVLEQIGPDGERLEPIESCMVDVIEAYAGKVIEMLGTRRGELVSVTEHAGSSRLIFEVPARGLIGLRSRLLTATSGEASLHNRFLRYDSYRGSLPARQSGTQVATETGKSTGYALESLEDRGPLFIGPGESVYEGQIVGEHCRDDDIEVNVCRRKGLTNVRASSSDKKIILSPPRSFSIEETLEYIAEDELAEFTPSSIRMRKRHLNAKLRKKAKRQELQGQV